MNIELDRPGLVRRGKLKGLTKSLEALGLGGVIELPDTKQAEVGSTMHRVGRRLGRVFSSRVYSEGARSGVRVYRTK